MTAKMTNSLCPIARRIFVLHMIKPVLSKRPLILQTGIWILILVIEVTSFYHSQQKQERQTGNLNGRTYFKEQTG